MIDKKKYYFGEKYSEIVMGLSIAASWTWAPALILSTDIAANKGLYGMLSFIIPNIIALLFFGYIQTKIPTGIITAKNLFKHAGVGYFYDFSMLLIQICCICIQITAGANVLKLITGFNYIIIVFLLVGGIFLYSYTGGFHYSVKTDVYQHLVLLVGTPVLLGYFFFSKEINYLAQHVFNINDTLLFFLILLSGPFMDNQHWQRSYNTERNNKPFYWGAFFFAIPLICLSLIGLFAGRQGNYISLSLFKGHSKWLLIICLLSGLFSTLDSSLASILTIFYTSNEKIFFGKLKMLLGVLLSTGVIIFNIDILKFWKTYGTIRIGFAFIILLNILCLQNRKKRNITC
ncbi:MAG: hypothetical protein ACFFG0_05470 [Candidatus Thorarchaeota archaeon]